MPGHRVSRAVLNLFSVKWILASGDLIRPAIYQKHPTSFRLLPARDMSVTPTGGRCNIHQIPEIKGCVPAQWETDIDALKIGAERKSNCEADRNVCISVTVVVPKLSTPPPKDKKCTTNPCFERFLSCKLLNSRDARY